MKSIPVTYIPDTYLGLDFPIEGVNYVHHPICITCLVHSIWTRRVAVTLSLTFELENSLKLPASSAE